MTERNSIARLNEISIGFPAPDGTAQTVVDRLSLTIGPGEKVGLIGASGSGKSLTALALLGLVPSTGSITGGTVEIDGVDIQTLSQSERAQLRGGAVGIVFQEAESALNPVMTVGAQFEETIRRHRPEEGDRWRYIAVDLLEEVDLDPVRTLKSHPHRLSGGQRQRVLLAIALAGDPDLLVADEPTSSLDVLTQARMLGLFDRLCRDRRRALLLISHDLGVVSSMVDRVIVMLAGAIVEEAPMEDFLSAPLHPYSQMLVATARESAPVKTEAVPNPAFRSGCAFAPRCSLMTAECERTFPDLESLGDGRAVRCPIVTAGVRP